MRRLPLALLFLALAAGPAFGYKIMYAEQYYRIYARTFYQYPERISESMYYLERCLKSDFANPLNALARIDNPGEWERYRFLFNMHVNLLLTELSLRMGSKYDKFDAYFYNAPWKDVNLKSLVISEQWYEYARIYWQEAQKWSEKAWGLPEHLEEIQHWHDENFRIETGDLDYGDIIDEQLDRLHRVRESFRAMDENTY